jgi:hypothetical protein
MRPVYLAIAVHLTIALHVVAKRVKAACRTNEPQAISVAVFTLLNLMAVMPHNQSASWPHPALITLALLFWPLFAFLVNLISPLPTPNKRP